MVRKVRTLVVDDARRPFARETVCCIADKIRAMFVPGSRDSLPRPLQIQDPLPRPLRIQDSLPRPLRMRAEALFTRPKNSGGSSGVYDHEGRGHLALVGRNKSQGDAVTAKHAGAKLTGRFRAELQ